MARRRARRRSTWLLGGALVVVAVGAFAWLTSGPATHRMCTLAAPLTEAGLPTPEEAARSFASRTDASTVGSSADDGGPAGYDRRSTTEWRRDLGDGRYQRLVVEEEDDGWHVVDANTCSEWQE